MAEKISREEMPARYQPLVDGGFKIHGVETCNYKPHPFTVGVQHVAEASDHYGGMLTEAVLRRIPCAYRDGYRRCQVPYEKHTYDVVMFVECLRMLPNAEAAGLLTKLKKAFEEDKVNIAGFAFIKSAQGFEILPAAKLPVE